MSAAYGKVSLAARWHWRNAMGFLRRNWKVLCIGIIVGLLMITGVAFADVDAVSHVSGIESGSEKDPLLKFSFGMIDEIAGPKIVREAGKLLSISFDGSEIHVGPYSSAGAGLIMDAIFSVTEIVAIIGLCVAFLSDLAMMKSNDLIEENVIRKLVLFTAGMMFVVSSMKICLWIANIGTGVADLVIEKMADPEGGAIVEGVELIKAGMWEESHSSEVLEASGVHIAWYEKIGNNMADFGAKMGFILQLIFPYLAVQLAWVITSVVCFSRAIELFIVAAFSPLAFMDSNVFDHFAYTPAWRFCKTILAISIQGAIIAGVLAIGSSFIGAVVNGSSSTAGEFAEQSVQIIMIVFAEVALVTRSQGIAKSVLAIG
ncbi:MAG: hypothetical protein J6M92_16690 [Oribacterium sp.]|nr:hypothetical protein [Oribacterium sp.]